MGLDNFKSSSTSASGSTTEHPYIPKIERWIEEFEDRFPVEINVEKVEVSSRMENMFAKAIFSATKDTTIRVSEKFINNSEDRIIKYTILHEMAHIYFYRQGFPKTKHDKYFRWVVGRVVGDLTHMSHPNEKWEQCIEPFIQEDNSWD
jgi:predicted SprT family Zn-dependent metalloprotease